MRWLEGRCLPTHIPVSSNSPVWFRLFLWGATDFEKWGWAATQVFKNTLQHLSNVTCYTHHNGICLPRLFCIFREPKKTGDSPKDASPPSGGKGEGEGGGRSLGPGGGMALEWLYMKPFPVLWWSDLTITPRPSNKIPPVGYLELGGLFAQKSFPSPCFRASTTAGLPTFCFSTSKTPTLELFLCPTGIVPWTALEIAGHLHRNETGS